MTAPITRAETSALTDLIHRHCGHPGSLENCDCERLADRIARGWAEPLLHERSRTDWVVIHRQNTRTLELHPAVPGSAAAVAERLVADGISDAVPFDLASRFPEVIAAAAGAGFAVERVAVTFPVDTADWAAPAIERHLLTDIWGGIDSDGIRALTDATGAEIASLVLHGAGGHVTLTSDGQYISASRVALDQVLTPLLRA